MSRTENCGKPQRSPTAFWRRLPPWIAFSAALILPSCAEGPLWTVGQYSPWVRKKWEAEEMLADTYFAKKRRMTELVAAAKSGTVEERDRAAQTLFQEYYTDPILLTRLQALKLMSELDCPTTYNVLQAASIDPNVDVRLAAAQGWRRMPDEYAVPALVQMLQHDRNVDVRLAATRALGDFTGATTVAALQAALSDPDPAIQLRATESLARATGEPLGRDVAVWKRFLGDDRVAARTPPEGKTSQR